MRKVQWLRSGKRQITKRITIEFMPSQFAAKLVGSVRKSLLPQSDLDYPIGMTVENSFQIEILINRIYDLLGIEQAIELLHLRYTNKMRLKLLGNCD